MKFVFRIFENQFSSYDIHNHYHELEYLKFDKMYERVSSCHEIFSMVGHDKVSSDSNLSYSCDVR